jgi:cytochrome c oxidase subunit 2
MRGWIMLSEPTQYAMQVDSVMLFIVISSIILLLGVTIAMVYFVIRYSRKRNPNPENIHGNTALEITWIVIPTILVLIMFYMGYTLFTDSRKVPDGAMNVKVTGRMWSWEFEYSTGKKSDTLYLPQGKSVKLNLFSSDINHALFIPDFRIKEDIISGRKNYFVIKPEKIGTYDIACAEYCGLNHSKMYTKLIVLTNYDFDRWVNSENSKSKIDSTGKVLN